MRNGVVALVAVVALLLVAPVTGGATKRVRWGRVKVWNETYDNPKVLAVRAVLLDDPEDGLFFSLPLVLEPGRRGVLRHAFNRDDERVRVLVDGSPDRQSGIDYEFWAYRTRPFFERHPRTWKLAVFDDEDYVSN